MKGPCPNSFHAWFAFKDEYVHKYVRCCTPCHNVSLYPFEEHDKEVEAIEDAPSECISNCSMKRVH